MATALALLLFPLASPADALTKRFFGITPATKLAEEEYAKMGAGNVGTLRVPFHWKDMEPAHGYYEWRRTDQIVANAARHGMRVAPFILDVPRWLQRRGDAAYYPPFGARGRAAWQSFLTALINRYKRGSAYWDFFKLYYPEARPQPIDTWQIWNEPSGRSYWRPNESSPERYSRFLQFSHDVVRSVDPRATVVSAGLFQAPQDGMRLEKFVRRFYDTRGVKTGFDAFALHPYARDLAGVKRQIRTVRRFMKEGGDEETPLWITEIGWPTLHEVESGAFVKTEAEQRELLEGSFEAILQNRRRWKVDRLVWYTWRDNDLFPACNLCRSAGLLRSDYSAKPSWRAFVRFTNGASRPSGSAGDQPASPMPPVP